MRIAYGGGRYWQMRKRDSWHQVSGARLCALLLGLLANRVRVGSGIVVRFPEAGVTDSDTGQSRRLTQGLGF